MSGTVLAYAATLALAVLIPGPAVLAVVSTGLAGGSRKAAATAAGVAAGDMLLGAVALLGLAAIIASAGWLLWAIKYGGALYLLWLGAVTWRARPSAAEGPTAGRDSLAAASPGLAVALGNPKAILFHASLMPLIIDLSAITARQAAALLSVILAVNLAVLCSYALLAGWIARWLREPSRLRWVNRSAGGAMIATAAAIASR